MTKFDGEKGISSADFFGGGPGSSGASRRSDNYDTGPDLAEIKDSVKQGVHKVAGRLSNIANGVMNSIQVSVIQACWYSALHTVRTRVIQYVCITRMKESDLELNVYMYDKYGLSNEHSTWFGIFWI